MSTVEYHLYRIKFIKPRQIEIFHENISASEIFAASLLEKPTTTLRQDNVWRVGNIEYFSDKIGAFAIGRTSQTTMERYDKESGNFIEKLDDSGPYTHILFDQSIGLLGIAKKSKVAPNVPAIAKKVKALFEKTTIIKNHGIEVRVDPIPDPDSFISKIKKAYSIKKFRAAFTGPNPIDADELFQKPLSVYCQEINGEHGNVEVKGTSLDEKTIEAVAKSTAATGNTASATIQPGRNEKTTNIQLKGDATRFQADSETPRKNLIAELQKIYYQVRT